MPTETTSIETIISMMVGRTLKDVARDTTRKPRDEIALEVKGLNCGALVKNVSFSLKRGEILGFAGLMGAGRTEVARAVFGADRAQSGEIWVRRQEGIRPLAQRRRRGRHRLPLGGPQALRPRRRHGRRLQRGDGQSGAITCRFASFCASGAIFAEAEKFVKLLGIRTPSLTQEVRLLSGGNQQKVVVAKWLARDCDVLFFDEPTRGIDVGAKAEIYKLLRELAAQGKAIVMISSELPEILRMSDRIVVMCEGRITGELMPEEATQERIMQLATQRETMAA